MLYLGNKVYWFFFFFIGNCLELVDNGIFNYVKCENFMGGCFDSYYFSDEIYRCKCCVLSS